jgi:hypothetical protein
LSSSVLLVCCMRRAVVERNRRLIWEAIVTVELSTVGVVVMC